MARLGIGRLGRHDRLGRSGPAGWASLLLVLALDASPARADWIRPQRPDDPLVFGVRGGLVLAVHPHALDARPQGGPRGLLRVGYEEGGRYYLVNYIAVEPVVAGRRGLSELERSRDGRPGKVFAVTTRRDAAPDDARVPGAIVATAEGPELRLAVHVEGFANGARPVLEVALREREPWRVRFRVFAADGSAPMDECVLTATMGNQSRCRNLWLADRAESALDLFAGYAGNDFAHTPPYPADRLHRTARGEVVAAITPDEFEPNEVLPLAGGAWHHPGRRMAQFWLKPPGTGDDTLRCRVNGRRVYWAGAVPIPGGPAFENFELNERFRPGVESWFGLAGASPHAALGFPYDLPPWVETRRAVPAEEADELRRAQAARRALAGGEFRDGLAGWTCAGGAAAFRTFEADGERRLTTFGAARDADTGRLYQCFVVPADAAVLRFHLHGGCDPEKLRVALWRGPVLARRMTARRDNAPFEVRWDVRALRGAAVTLEVVDELATAWGFLGVHGIEVVRE